MKNRSSRAPILAVSFLAFVMGCRSEPSPPASVAAPALDPTVKRSVDLSTGITAKYREAGSPGGDPVLMLHGITDTSRSFLPLMQHLARLRPDLHLIAPDLRGHGDSSMPPAPGCSEAPERCFRIADFAADTAALMDSMGIDRAHLVGHSIGSAVAQEIALTSPSRIRRLVLIGSAARFAGSFATAEFLMAGLIEGSWKNAFERGGGKWPAGAYDLTAAAVDPDAAEWLKANWVFDPVADPAFLSEVLPETLNIRLGTGHLGSLLRRFGGSAPLAVAAYNAGEALVRSWLRSHGELPLDEFVEEMPVQETRGYVKRVLRSYAAYRLLYGGPGETPVALSQRLPQPR